MDREATMDEALGMRAGPLPRGVHALVEDEIAAGGGFVLAHLLARALGRRDDDDDGGVEEGGGFCEPRVAARLPRVRGAGLRASRAGDGQAGTQPPRGRLERGAGGRRRAHDALRVVRRPRGFGPESGNRGGGEAHTRRADASGLDGARDLFRAIARALGDDDDDGDAVVVFDSLNALADGEPTAWDADRAVPSLLASVSSLRRGRTAIVALAGRDACAGRVAVARPLARRRADVVVSCRALTTGHATDVHGHVLMAARGQWRRRRRTVRRRRGGWTRGSGSRSSARR